MGFTRDNVDPACGGPPSAAPSVLHGFFKTPSLSGVKKTAPYFHDNSAKTLEEVAAFYTNLFANNPDFPVQLLVPWNRDDLHKPRSAAPGWQGAKSELIEHT
jgi:hypothetical protein